MTHDRYRFDTAAREAVYRAIKTRRDVRSYRPEPVPDDVLRRLLEAAHRAPSVGFMQPWSFLLLRDRAIRERVHAHFLEVNARAAAVHGGARGLTYQSLKLQGILDAPLNLLVTCDRQRGGEHVLGRFTTPETDLYSTCLAVQNLWLAARAEGLGVGWMSIAEEGALRSILGIPEHVVPVAYLTLGWPVELPESPLLERVGWRRRLPLEELIFEDRWGNPAAPLRPAPAAPTPAPEAVSRRRERLIRPPGSLGRLEQAAVAIAAIQGRARPRMDRRCLLLLAGDHGVTAEGVSAYRAEVTAKMVYQIVSGGAAVCAIARQNGLAIQVADLGVDHDFGEATAIAHHKIRRGTRNLALEPAMSTEEARAAIAAGAELVSALGELDLLALGELGIGNSTAAAALTAALLGLSPAAATGRGTGVGPRTRAHKAAVVARALARHGSERDPTRTLASLGGFELAGLVGAIEEAARRRIPVLLDGAITAAAALVAVRRTPSCQRVLLAGHRSAEPSHGAALEALELEPLLDLGLCLGEGSGAAIAAGLLACACRIDAELCTFEEAGIAHPELPDARR